MIDIKTLSLKVEKENDMSLVSKAMAMKCKSTEKRIELSNLEEALNVLKEKHRKLPVKSLNW